MKNASYSGTKVLNMIPLEQRETDKINQMMMISKPFSFKALFDVSYLEYGRLYYFNSVQMK